MKEIKAIVFDFDGVITKRGEAIKEEAWGEVARVLESEELDASGRFAVLLRGAQERYGKGTAKGTRVDVVRDALQEFYGVSIVDEAKVRRYVEKYNVAVQKMIADEGVYEETLSALQSLSLRMPLFVSSATPINAVVESITRLGLNKFFQGIFGHPTKKVDAIDRIREEFGFAPEHILYVGDSQGDLQAAEDAGVYFVGVANPYNKWGEEAFPTVRRLDEVENILTNL